MKSDARTVIPTVTDWYALTAQFPECRTLSLSPLKQYGYMEVMHEVLKRNSPETRVLEFGHMFSNELFLRLQDQVEMWGIDDIGDEHYIPQGEEWERAYKINIAEPCKNTHLVRGYLGRDADLLPKDYFDVVCSVSVFDNIQHEHWSGVTRHAYEVLRPGGIFVNTLDYPLKHEEYLVDKLIRTQRDAGFGVADPSHAPEPDHRLIESQFAVICYFQAADPERGRTYLGNYGTVLTVSCKE